MLLLLLSQLSLSHYLTVKVNCFWLIRLLSSSWFNCRQFSVCFLCFLNCVHFFICLTQFWRSIKWSIFIAWLPFLPVIFCLFDAKNLLISTFVPHWHFCTSISALSTGVTTTATAAKHVNNFCCFCWRWGYNSSSETVITGTINDVTTNTTTTTATTTTEGESVKLQAEEQANDSPSWGQYHGDWRTR